MTRETWHAFAKINLELQVVGRRPDGFHEIRTLMETVDLWDEIHVAPSTAFVFTSNEAPHDETNLVVRAVRAFESMTGRTVSLRIDLRKRVPSGAGLGGGSADAAVTAMGLDRYFGTELSGDSLHRLLASLGSDVPFFQVGGRARAVGRGERVFPIPDPPDADAGERERWFLLLCPGISISTAEAYSWLTQTPESNTILGFCGHFAPEPGAMRPGRDACLNDFERPLFGRFPELAEVKRRLLASGARFAAVSGSGSALFGEFGSEAAARSAAEQFVGLPGLGREPAVVRSVGRREYMRRIFGLPV